MKFSRCKIDGVRLVDLEWLRDDRGGFARAFCFEEFAAEGIDFSIAQANISINTDAGTLRGLHYQKPPHGEAKLVRCVRGRVFDVVVDMRPESATYCDWYGVELTGERGNALFIPPYVAHGFLTLTPGCEVHYLMGARFEPDAATGVRWNDPAFGITWPREPAILAERDAAYPDLQR